MKRILLLMVACIATFLLAACSNAQSLTEVKAFDYRVAKSFGSPDTYAFASVGHQHSVTIWSADKSFSFQANYGPVAGSNLVGGSPVIGYSAGAFLRYDDKSFFGFAGVSAYGLVEQGKPISGSAGFTAGLGWRT